MSEEYSGTYNLEIMDNAENYNRFIINQVSKVFSPNDLLVDFGCGTGNFLVGLHNRGYKVLGIEIDLGLRNHVANQKKLQVVATLDEVQVPISQMYMINVLEHIENDREFLKSVYKKSTNGSRLLIYVPAHKLLFSEMDSYVGHWRRYSREGLTSMLSSAGFLILESKYCDSLGVFATMLYKILPWSKGQLNLRAIKVYDRVFFPVSAFFDKIIGYRFGKNLLVVAEKLIRD